MTRPQSSYPADKPRLFLVQKHRTERKWKCMRSLGTLTQNWCNIISDMLIAHIKSQSQLKFKGSANRPYFLMKNAAKSPGKEVGKKNYCLFANNLPHPD